jgi:predicted ATP-dependent serine protease
MINATCPKCGASVTATENKKRRRLVGKCAGCGWWGTIGKLSEKESSNVPASGEKQPEVKTTKQTAPASSGARKRTGTRGAAKASRTKAAGKSVRGRQPRELIPHNPKLDTGSFWNRVKGFFDSDI